MTIEDYLDIMEKSKRFDVQRKGMCYDVSFKDERSWEYGDDLPIIATFTEQGRWEYYIKGVYNNGSDFERINVDRLMELKAFCESIGGDGW